LTLEFATDKSVLDVASGEGHGAAMLSRVARSVTGVLLDPEAVRHARHNYYFSNLNFLVGGCAELPVPDASVDLVTSFETIEHHDLYELMMREVKRVLKPGGILIISSPNRLVYSDERNYGNPSGVKELHYDGFRELLGRHFKHQRLYGQRLAAGSFVFPLQGPDEDTLRAYSGDREHLSQQMCRLPAPAHFVAVCSDAVLPEQPTISSFYIDPKNDLLEHLQVEKQRLFEQMRKSADASSEREQSYEAQIESVRAELSAAREGYELQIAQLAGELTAARSEGEALRARTAEELSAAGARESELERQVTELERQTAELRTQMEQQAAAHSEMQSHLLQRNAALAEMHSQLLRKDEVLNWIQTSRSWKGVTSLRYLYHRSGASVNRLLRGMKLPTADSFKGVIESPAQDASCSKYIDVAGWVATTGARVTLVEAFLDGFFLGTVRYSSERPDIAATLPSRAWKVYGYAERLTLYNSFEGQRTLTLRAFDQDGHSHLFERQITVTYSAELVQESAQGVVAQPVGGPPAPGAARAGAEQSAPAPVKVFKREEVVKADFVSQMEEVVGKFEDRMNRAPFILNWNTGLELSDAFPHLAIMSPCASNGHLSYLDRSVDIVLVPSRSNDRLAEARRVAAAAVVHVEGLGSGKKEQLSSSKERSKLRLRAEWRDEEALESALPETSIIIPVYNKVEYTRNCLAQLLNTLPANFRGEIIVIDDASTDETPAVIEEFAGRDARIRSLRNEQNAGFIRSCNRAAEAAAGEVIVFLNNDTLPQPNWLPPLLKVLQDYPDAGAVGGKLLYPDGTLQEAGGIIFSDASGCNFGKHDKAASAPLYSFLREVDYCSGALLATRRELFMRLGGFDTLYAPAYYEDTDYCFSLREKGYRVYYQPDSAIIHFEGVTSGTDVGGGVKKYQEVNRAKFQAKWQHFLRHHPAPPRQYDFATLHELSVRSWPRVNHES
jgi:GT2 family glycosyltransferase/SAM-dependent methyltransferase